MPCPYCHGQLLLREGKYGPYYGCENYPDCEGSSGAHPDGRPLGRPSVREEKDAKILAHKLFDEWRKRTGITRTESYKWLDHLFKKSNVHIANLDIKELKTLIMEVQKEMKK
jgi:ssDNA-binding Zn-finger/Zn-ribbon topoisomerase 1